MGSCEPDLTRCWELYTLRGALEALAAKLAAENMDATKRRTLMEAFERLTAAASFNDPKAITDADLSLHKTIVLLSGHRRLADQYALVERQVRMYIHRQTPVSQIASKLCRNTKDWS